MNKALQDIRHIEHSIVTLRKSLEKGMDLENLHGQKTELDPFYWNTFKNVLTNQEYMIKQLNRLIENAQSLK